MFILYTRNDPFCQWCQLAKEYLDLKDVKYQEIIIGQELTKEEYREMFREYYPNNPEKRPTVPLLVGDWLGKDDVIGGYEDIKKWFN